LEYSPASSLFGKIMKISRADHSGRYSAARLLQTRQKTCRPSVAKSATEDKITGKTWMTYREKWNQNLGA